ncbi:cation diffusion facilitator family transporter [Tumebacillus sp. BK434]|uniref:cation diffusion facilitator family transporter n=1 Tax=Tumebacillus sp. BK434 TaxID=2512169 RepID=UPI0010537E55|nr:cation diffusion facilitator family transporter [Tumebacillus sp. BK434]
MSSAAAAVGNTALAILKGIAAMISGSGAMFASTMHSVADAVNQGFVFVGSVLAERKPTRRFPTGFGRVINLFCMIAVIVVTMMAYETIREGIHLLQHPASVTTITWDVIALSAAILVDGFVLIKAMQEIVREARVEAKGFGIISASFRNAKHAAPPTRLVFYEDLVATLGAALALTAVLVTRFTDNKLFDGSVTIMIGVMMLFVAFKIGYDNMVGLIGVAAPREVEERVAAIIFSDPDVTDINKMRIVQEGRTYHVEAYIELRPGLTLADADDIKYRVRDLILADPNVSDVTMGILEDDGVKNWVPQEM